MLAKYYQSSSIFLNLHQYSSIFQLLPHSIPMICLKKNIWPGPSSSGAACAQPGSWILDPLHGGVVLEWLEISTGLKRERERGRERENDELWWIMNDEWLAHCDLIIAIMMLHNIWHHFRPFHNNMSTNVNPGFPWVLGFNHIFVCWILMI